MKYKIMLIEDEEIIRAGLKSLIEEVITGYEVICEASNGEDALGMFEKSQPDIVITDIRMEKMGGIEAIRCIKNMNPNTPIIIISGYDDFSYVKSALKYQVSDYLLKPVDRIELAQALASVSRAFGTEEPAAEEESGGHPAIKQVKSIINQRLHEEISLTILSKMVHINHQYLSTLFKNETGMSFSRYVVHQRMEKAKKLLKETNLKVYEVSDMCGYKSTKQFTSLFKQMCGTTPTDYKSL